MSKFAPVVPTGVARALEEQGLMGDYHLLLAHDVLAKPDEYRDLYNKPEYTVILDNSVIELGKSVTPKVLLEAAQFVNPRWIVVPDELHDFNKTLSLSQVFAEHYSEIQGSKPLLMGVPQGRNLQEFCNACDIMLERFKFDSLGIPRLAVAHVGSRLPILLHLLYRYPHKRFHLLGFSENHMDDLCCARMPNVMGIDSAVPIRLGMQHRLVDIDTQVWTGSRGDYWKQVKVDADQMKMVAHNLAMVRRLIATQPVH